ncbi:unnamed protein product [Caenorhabditis brenneri]
MFSPTILLILNLALPAFGISCYKSDPLFNTQGVQHHMSFCTAIYDVANKHGTFNGGDRDSIRTEKFKLDSNLGKDCKVQKVQNDVDGEWFETYTCHCFTPMCNFPFSFEEFKARGFTLAPHPSKAVSIW